MEYQPHDMVLVSATFVGADGKERRLDAEHVEVRQGSCVEALMRAAVRQFSDVLPPDPDRVVVSKYVTNASSTFVRIRASRLIEEKCHKCTEYRMEFLRPGQADQEYYTFNLHHAHDVPCTSKRPHVDVEDARLGKDIIALQAKRPKIEFDEPSHSKLDSINEPASKMVRSESDDVDSAASVPRSKQPKAEAGEAAHLDVVIDLNEWDASLLLDEAEDNVCEDPLDDSLSRELQEPRAGRVPTKKSRSRPSVRSKKSCPFCGRVIKSGRTSNLNAHIAYWCPKKEYGPPKLACSKCGKKFHAPSSLKNHMRFMRCAVESAKASS